MVCMGVRGVWGVLQGKGRLPNMGPYLPIFVAPCIKCVVGGCPLLGGMVLLGYLSCSEAVAVV